MVLSNYQIQELEQDKRDLERQVNDLKAKCEQIEKRAAEQRAVEEKKHTEEIQFLKRTNQQLKVKLIERLSQFFKHVLRRCISRITFLPTSTDIYKHEK